MIGGGVTALGGEAKLQVHAYISLKDARHKKGQLPTNDANFKFTNFNFYVKYKESANRSFKYKPYLITADIFDTFGGSIRVSGYEEFLKLGETNPEVAWLIRNTIHSEELFELAKNNYHLPMMLAFDPVKYMKRILEKENKKDGSGMDVFLVEDIKKAEKARHKQYLEQFKKKEVKL